MPRMWRSTQWNISPTNDADAARRRFRAGELDLQSPAPLAQIGWLRANLAPALKITPSLAVAYLAINLSSPKLQDVRVRRALNLAIDREAITQKILKLGEPPAYGIVPPGTAGYAGGVSFDFRKLPFAARLAKAQKLMRDAGYGPANRLALAYATTTSPDNRRLAAAADHRFAAGIAAAPGELGHPCHSPCCGPHRLPDCRPTARYQRLCPVHPQQRGGDRIDVLFPLPLALECAGAESLDRGDSLVVDPIPSRLDGRPGLWILSLY
jgi:hypothetical protein